MKWGDSQRDSDTILAVWPKYRALWDQWALEELVDRGEMPPYWRDRRRPSEEGYVRADTYPTQSEALEKASELNFLLEKDFEGRQMPPEVRTSLRLKVRKNLQSKDRLANEEALMLSQAKHRHVNAYRPTASDLVLPEASERFRDELAEQLSEMPYLRMALVGPRTGRRLLFALADHAWTDPRFPTKAAAEKAVRARIAHGFGLSANQHWGETKAKIRDILLPRANKLLQLASVQRLLAEHLAAGQRVLVCNGIVFWYEVDGDVGWQIKETAPASKSEEGATLWEKGTILSKNHGRLVILPYVKENGELVPGHTRNAPHDGPAFPRHPDHFVGIPFERLRDDLMIGLLGELPYE